MDTTCLVECDRGGAGPLPKPYLPPFYSPSRSSLPPTIYLDKGPSLPFLNSFSGFRFHPTFCAKYPSPTLQSIFNSNATTTTTTASTTTHQTQQTCVSNLPFLPLRPPSLSPAPRTSRMFLSALYVPLLCPPCLVPAPPLAAPLESRRASARYNPIMTHVTDNSSPRFLASSLLSPPLSAVPPTSSASAPLAVNPSRRPSWPVFPPSATKPRL